jgi:hypothetical protein
VKVHLYAVVRHDAGFTDPHLTFTVKEVLPTLDEAKAEVDRLNRGAPRGVTYFWQTTRFYPSGRRVDVDRQQRKRTLRVVKS